MSWRQSLLHGDLRRCDLCGRSIQRQDTRWRCFHHCGKAALGLSVGMELGTKGIATRNKCLTNIIRIEFKLKGPLYHDSNCYY